MLGFIRRNSYNCSEKTKQSEYFTLVRPHLEYASAAWDSYTKTKIKELEKVQHRAAIFVKNYKSRESGVTGMMKELKWESQERGIETSRIVMFYKSLHGGTVLPLPFHLVRANGNTRGHSERFVQVSAKTLVYATCLCSFYNRTVNDWTGLSLKPLCLHPP